ncbi:TetR/AcrR family transcriptional regulator [Kitasatospora kifunensis]|uniref:AcrR family transcriptional regulator n=1 Tax=Kitasatospora kifunensis TaxID=58351 RepID=A0A7W7QXB5_KITKI|nr:TetR/AcrR family transcriptional regulator [Kitasatospora kifunensis]MBB4921429.1 AcrR family transcriptional regulator [Kitasatospora kifunensis]
MPTRQRLSPAERRTQLLAVGARLFAAHPYDDVLMEDIAEQAGVSRALLYRHFPNKRELFAALYRQAADQLLEQVPLHPAGDFLEQLTAGLDVHIDYFVANRNTVLAANRALAGDLVIQSVITEELDVLRARLLDVLSLADDAGRATVSAVLRSWLVFVRVLCVDWLTTPTCTRTDLRDTCIGALVGSLRPLLATDPAPDWPR